MSGGVDCRLPMADGRLMAGVAPPRVAPPRVRSIGHRPSAIANPRRARGLSLVEVLICLSITAMLLTAVAVAFAASASAIEINDEFFRATQGARVSLVRVLTDVRQGTVEEDALTDTVRLITTPTDGGVARDRTYQYRSATKELMMITNDVAGDPDYVLARNVTAVNFTKEIGQDATGTNCVTRLAMTITVSVGKNAVQLSGSAAPRRYLIH